LVKEIDIVKKFLKKEQENLLPEKLRRKKYHK